MTRWAGRCTRCERDGVEVETRYEHAARVLCDACAALPLRRPNLAEGALPSSRRPETPQEPGATQVPDSVEACGGSWGVLDAWTTSMCRALGFDEPEFACVLPGHDHAARVIRSPRGHWRHVCEMGEMGLAEVRAVQAYGEARRVSDVELARWRERLLFEAGMLQPRAVSLTLPDDVRPAQRRLSEGFALLLALRDERWKGEPVTFARRFASAWSGVTEDQARRWLPTLIDLGVTTQTGHLKTAHRSTDLLVAGPALVVDARLSDLPSPNPHVSRHNSLHHNHHTQDSHHVDA